MSQQAAASAPMVEAVLVPRAQDLGAFEVRRTLPAKERQMVGPFIFFDQFGPAILTADKAMDVRPHPHIGLSTLTWLMDGEVMHRDSLGSAQLIRPGEVNWMTAGRGIVHSERTPEKRRGQSVKVYGLQTWLALPKEHEETDPSFTHVPAADIPAMEGDGIELDLIAGNGWGLSSRVPTFSDTLYADVRMEAGARLSLPSETEERAVYPLTGNVEIGGETFGPHHMVVIKPGIECIVTAQEETHVIVLGGATMDGPRLLWWNFVASSRERLNQAKADWEQGHFPTVPGDEDEFIPLPRG